MNLMIVDMIEGFARTGTLASPRVEALIPLQVAFIKQMPEDSFIVLVCDNHIEGDSEFKRMPVHCLRGSDEAKVCPEILDAIKARGIPYEIIEKRTHSAFFNTNLDAIIKARAKSDDWVVFGCVTDVCITANVMELDYRGKNVTVVRDLVDTYEINAQNVIDLGLPQVCLHMPDAFNTMFFDHYLPGVWGAKIQTAEEVLK